MTSHHEGSRPGVGTAASQTVSLSLLGLPLAGLLTKLPAHWGASALGTEGAVPPGSCQSPVLEAAGTPSLELPSLPEGPGSPMAGGPCPGEHYSGVWNPGDAPVPPECRLLPGASEAATDLRSMGLGWAVVCPGRVSPVVGLPRPRCSETLSLAGVSSANSSGTCVRWDVTGGGGPPGGDSGRGGPQGSVPGPWRAHSTLPSLWPLPAEAKEPEESCTPSVSCPYPVAAQEAAACGCGGPWSLGHRQCAQASPGPQRGRAGLGGPREACCQDGLWAHTQPAAFRVSSGAGADCAQTQGPFISVGCRHRWPTPTPLREGARG